MDDSDDKVEILEPILDEQEAEAANGDTNINHQYNNQLTLNQDKTSDFLRALSDLAVVNEGLADRVLAMSEKEQDLSHNIILKEQSREEKTEIKTVDSRIETIGKTVWMGYSLSILSFIVAIVGVVVGNNIATIGGLIISATPLVGKFLSWGHPSNHIDVRSKPTRNEDAGKVEQIEPPQEKTDEE